MFIKYTQFSLVILIVILVLTLLPGDEVAASGGVQLDKITHFVLFTALVVSGIIGCLKQYQFRFINRNAVLVVASFGVFIGLLTEILQLIVVKSRSFEVSDLIADFAGVGLGVIIFRLLMGKENFEI